MASSPPVYEMRTQITKVYPGIKWANKVKAMTDAQVIATWNRMSRSGQLNKPISKRNDVPPIK